MATIIKSATHARHASASEVRAAAFDLVDMSSRADEYVRSVQSEAAKIIQEAHRQAEEIRRSAEQAGRQAAKEAANRVLDEKVAQRMQTILPALRKAVDQVLDERARWHRECEMTLVRLAVVVAERLIRREVRDCPEIPQTWIRESLEMASGAATMTVRLHPHDLEGLGRQVERLGEEIGRLAPPRIVADETIDKGGCVVQTEFGTIDMQLPAQLARMEEELLG
jgi:flagellar biosynthesis/type III secretory pathway protein FliH